VSLISSIYVPGVGPSDARILFIGEAPGGEEEERREPFVGASGQLLMDVLRRHGVQREEVRLDNLSPHRPSSNKFENLLKSQQLHEGIAHIHQYIREARPNVICTLGRWPTQYVTGRRGIQRFRGSILTAAEVAGATDVKVIPTYHPSAVLRDGKLYPIFDHDIRRVVFDSGFPDTRIPAREIIVAPDGYALEEAVQVCLNAQLLGCDIENIKQKRDIICIGFAPTPRVAYVFPWTHVYFDAIYRILTSPVAKVFHFGTHDTTVLRLNGIEVNGYAHDTLTQQHVLTPEFPKSLDFITSIRTRQPYYKDRGRTELPSDAKEWGEKVNKMDVYEYNGMDCCVTRECHDSQYADILEDADLLRTYQFEMSLIPVARHIGDSGMLIDTERRKLLEHALLHSWAYKQYPLNKLAGSRINVKSPKLKDYLYGQLKLPVRRKRDGAITTDEDAIVSLIGYVKDRLSTLKRAPSIAEWEFKESVLRAILEIRGYRQLLSNYILVPISSDSRLRSTYKVSGPETGRWAAAKYVDGTGCNPQTLPRGKVELPEQLIPGVEMLADELDETDIYPDNAEPAAIADAEEAA